MSATSNITKEGIEVKPGQVWCDLDKRMAERQLQVISVSDGKAVMCKIGDYLRMRTTISIHRMHKTSTGWALVSEAP